MIHKEKEINSIFNSCLHSDIKCTPGREFLCWQSVGDEKEHLLITGDLAQAHFSLHVPWASPLPPPSYSTCRLPGLEASHHPSSATRTGSLPSQIRHLVVSDSLWPHGLHHARVPCPSPTPRGWSSLCPSSWWCHPTISSSAVPFSFCLQSFPASGSFPMSQLFTALGGSGRAPCVRMAGAPVAPGGLRVSAWPGRWPLLCPAQPSPSLLALLCWNMRSEVLRLWLLGSPSPQPFLQLGGWLTAASDGAARQSHLLRGLVLATLPTSLALSPLLTLAYFSSLPSSTPVMTSCLSSLSLTISFMRQGIFVCLHPGCL